MTIIWVKINFAYSSVIQDVTTASSPLQSSVAAILLHGGLIKWAGILFRTTPAKLPTIGANMRVQCFKGHWWQTAPTGSTFTGTVLAHEKQQRMDDPIAKLIQPQLIPTFRLNLAERIIPAVGRRHRNIIQLLDQCYGATVQNPPLIPCCTFSASMQISDDQCTTTTRNLRKTDPYLCSL